MAFQRQTKDYLVASQDLFSFLNICTAESECLTGYTQFCFNLIFDYASTNTYML